MPSELGPVSSFIYITHLQYQDQKKIMLYSTPFWQESDKSGDDAIAYYLSDLIPSVVAIISDIAAV